jgi:L-seryl-tRNA(Ser) seleniumtransferase
VEAVSLVEDVAYAGGGSLPDQALRTWVLELTAGALSVVELACRLRTGRTAVVGRLREGKLILDVRTVFPHQEADLVEAVRDALAPAALPPPAEGLGSGPRP